MGDLELLELLKNGAKKIGLELPEGGFDTLIQYLKLLRLWNKTYNLTAITDAKEIVVRHLLDSLAVATYLCGQLILDFGTGAGLPGIPLALAFPKRKFILLDSQHKKTAFVQQVVWQLKIPNVTVVTQRAENYQPESLSDTIITRATLAASEFYPLAKRLVKTGGLAYLMKGKDPQLECAALPAQIDWEVRRIMVPYLNAERHLIEISL